MPFKGEFFQTFLKMENGNHISIVLRFHWVFLFFKDVTILKWHCQSQKLHPFQIFRMTRKFRYQLHMCIILENASRVERGTMDEAAALVLLFYSSEKNNSVQRGRKHVSPFS